MIRLRDLLERIAADRILADSLALKGGTPLNLCFGVPPRLSVDLDFNYIGAADRAVMLTARPDIVAALERLGRRAGYQVQQSPEDHAGQAFYFRYQSALGNAARLQVDINFLFRTPIVPVQSHPVWSPLEEASLETSVVGMGELMAGKMLALIDRSAPRDLFDVARYAARTGLPALGTRDRLIFIALSGMLNHPLTNYTVERVQRVTDDTIETQLYPLLQMGRRLGPPGGQREGPEQRGATPRFTGVLAPAPFGPAADPWGRSPSARNQTSAPVVPPSDHGGDARFTATATPPEAPTRQRQSP